jgi:hypothetical protein
LDRAKYAEAELLDNRAAVLLFGGTAAERQAWAEETAQRLGSPVTLVTAAASLPAALAQKDGVVYVADAVALGDVAQQKLVHCLLLQEERPKLVVGVQHGLESHLGGGGLRPDLHYRLRLSQLSLDEPGLREAIAKRRARRAPPSAKGALRPSRAKTPARYAAKTASKRRPAGRAKPKRSGRKA